MSFDCMLMGGLVIAVCMMFCGFMVGLRGMLVMLRCFLMCVMGHRSPLGEASLIASETLRHLREGQHLWSVKISRRLRGARLDLIRGSRLAQRRLTTPLFLLLLPIDSVMSFLSTTGGVVPVDSA